MNLRIVSSFIIVLFSLDCSFSSNSPLGRDDSEFSDDLDPRSPIAKTFSGIGLGGDKENETVKIFRPKGAKKTRGKRWFNLRADSPTPPNSDSEEVTNEPSVVARRRDAKWNIEPLSESEEIAQTARVEVDPHSEKRNNILTKKKPETFLELTARIDSGGGTRKEKWEQIRLETAGEMDA